MFRSVSHRLSRSALLLGVFWLLLSGALLAGDPKPPKIDFSQKFFFFGFTPTNKVARHDYWIYNRGGSNLAIAEVKPGCSCTTYDLARPIVTPGDSTRLSVYFDAEYMFRRVIKKLTITSNDPLTPVDTIVFGAIANEEHNYVKADPQSLGFTTEDLVKPGVSHTVTLNNSSDQVVKLKLVDVPSDYLEVFLSRDKIPPHRDAKIEVKVTKLPEKSGLVETSLTVEFELEAAYRLTVPIVMMVPAAAVSP